MIGTPPVVRDRFGNVRKIGDRHYRDVCVCVCVCVFLCFSEENMHFNYEADLMLDSVNRRYKKIVLSTYATGMAMTVVGCLLVL